MIEQPLSANDLTGYLKFPSKIKDIIALDEIIVNFKDALKLSSDNYGRIFNIKLMKCGGITSGQQIANQAFQNNIDLMWGCNDESILSISAALNTALSYKNTKSNLRLYCSIVFYLFPVLDFIILTILGRSVLILSISKGFPIDHWVLYHAPCKWMRYTH